MVMTATPDTSHSVSPLQKVQRLDEPSEKVTAPEATHLDPGNLARHVIEGLSGLILANPNAGQRLGLKAIARCPQKSTAWYFSTTSCLGAFEAALLSGSSEGNPNVRLALRYFPDPREALFTRFAPVEQQARLSPIFDPAGTPRPDSAEQIDPGLFHLGSLVLAAQGANHVGLCLSAQDLWIEHMQKDGVWFANREVPGLRLALTVLDPLVCALSYLGRQPPSLVRAWRRPGFASYIETDIGARSRPEPSASAWEIEVQGLIVPGRTASSSPAQVLTRALEQPVFEYSGEIPPHYAPWPVTPQWWQAAGWQFDPVSEFGGQRARPAHKRDELSAHTFNRTDDDERNF